MDIFFTLVLKIIPLYFIIFLGFIAGRYLKAQKETVAKLLIYLIVPVVIFSSILTLKLSPGVLSLPILFFIICSLICLVTYRIAQRFWQDATKNILAFTAGNGNTGYFGLPVAIALFGPDIAGLVIISTLGLLVYENSLGFYITARGNYSPRESLKKLIKLPTIYAFAFGLLFNLAGLKFGQSFFDFAALFRGAYSVLGMMLIGMGIASVTVFKFDYRFIFSTLFTKFVVWPLVMGLVILLDVTYIHLFNAEIYKVLTLLSIVPLAANTVAYATELNTHPEKASVAVLISTIVALFYIPLMASLFLY